MLGIEVALRNELLRTNGNLDAASALKVWV